MVVGQAPLGPTPRIVMSTNSNARSRVAAIDLGTNNCRLLVAKASVDGFEVVDAFSRPVRLGEGVALNGSLCGDAIERTLGALDVCAAKIARHKVTRARHIATEACRRACNGDDFLSLVRQRTGLNFEVIPAAEEARLALASCENLLDPEIPYGLLVDIGGGSTEFVRGIPALATPQAAEAWRWLGVALHKQGRIADAVPAYRQALALKPANTLTAAHLGEAGQSHAALLDGRTAPARHPDDPRRDEPGAAPVPAA